MKMLTNEQKEKIKEEIDERIQSFTCPICHNKGFIIADNYFVNMLHDDFSKVTFGGQGIPTIAIICNNCGFVSQHALGIIGLLSENQKNK